MNSTNSGILYSVSSGLLLLYLLSLGFNHDNSIRLTKNSVTSKYLALLTKLEGLSLIHVIFAILFIFLFTIVSVVINNTRGKVTRTLSGVINIILIIGAIITFLFSTYNYYNIKYEESCKWTQLTILRRKYYKMGDKEKEKEKDKEKNKNRKPIFVDYNTSIVYRLFYFLGLILLTYSTIREKIFDIRYIWFIIGYFVMGLFIQLIPSFILYQNSEYNEWPSLFSYLDQYIQNTNDPRKYVFTIIGAFRIIILLLMSIYLGYRYGMKNSFGNITHSDVLRIVYFSWFIFIVILIALQIFLGDGCVIERTLDEYKEGRREVDQDYSVTFKSFIDALVCSIDNQLGIYFHIIIIAICLSLVGYNQKNIPEHIINEIN